MVVYAIRIHPIPDVFAQSKFHLVKQVTYWCQSGFSLNKEALKNENYFSCLLLPAGSSTGFLSFAVLELMGTIAFWQVISESLGIVSWILRNSL